MVSARVWETPQAPVPTLQATQHKGLDPAETPVEVPGNGLAEETQWRCQEVSYRKQEL